MRSKNLIAFVSGASAAVLLFVALPATADDTPCPAPAAVAVPAVAASPPQTNPPSPMSVVLNELLPDPIGRDADGEFIELANLDARDASISGWTVTDAKQHSFAIPETLIAANGFLILPYSQTKLALTNDGGTFMLMDASGTAISTTAYGKAKEGKSWERHEDAAWDWNDTPTPGMPNATATVAPTTIVTPVSETPPPATALAESAASADPAPGQEPLPSSDASPPAPEDATAPPEMQLDAVPDANEGAEVTVTGIVTLQPGVIGKTIFAIQDAEGSGGIFVRVTGADIPALQIGDEVEIVGRVRKKTGQPRISARASAISKLGRGTPRYGTREPGEIDIEDTGQAIETRGFIADRGSHWLLVADESGDGSVRVFIPDATPTASIAKGDAIAVRGVARKTSKGVEIAVAARKDIETTHVTEANVDGKPATTLPVAKRQPLFLAEHPKADIAWIWWIAITALAAASAGFAYYRHRKDAHLDG